MIEIPLLRDIVVILVASVLVLVVSSRLRIPTIVGFLITGMIIGPYGLGLVRSVHEVELLAEIGIVLLLFTIGMEFSVKELLRAKTAVLVGGMLQVALTAAVFYGVARLFREGSPESIFIGFLVALSSTAIVLKTLQERAELESPHGRVILSILILQDIAIVPMMLVTPMLAPGASEVDASIGGLILRIIGVVVLAVVGARWIVPAVLFQITRTRSRELFLIGIAAIGMTVAWSTNQLGLSLGLGAFIAGLVISESEYSHQALDGILPLRDVFNSFFFVSVGMLLDFSFVAGQPFFLLSIAVMVFVVKSVLAGGVGLALGLSPRYALLAGLGLGQVGEFSFVLSKVGVEYGLLDNTTYQMFIAVSVFTMLATPFVITYAPRLADRVSDMPLLGRRRSEMKNGGRDYRDLQDHIIIVGFGLNGHNLAAAARQAGISYVIIETNPETVKQERFRKEPIFYGDATFPAVLESAGVDRARILVLAISDPTATRRITRLAHELNQNLHIIVRTRFITEVKPLLELGANEVVPEEFETSIEIFTRVLAKYLVTRDEIERFTSEIRSGAYEMLRSLSSPGPAITDLTVNIPALDISAIRVEAEAEADNRTLAELNLRGRCGVTVVAIERDGAVRSNPGGDTRLQAGDILYVLGTPGRVCDVTAVIGRSPQ